MKYDFETIVNRKNTVSAKWEGMKSLNPNVSEGIIPLSVADMELKNPPEIIKGLQEYLEDVILGYPTTTERYLGAVTNWTKRRYNWETKPEWLINTPGVVNAFFQAVKAFTNKGDGVIVMTPVYYPFYMAVEKNERNIVRNPLILNEEGKYEIDFNDLREKAKVSTNKLLILSNPHNPVGRVWTEEELRKVGEICLENNVLVVSDEIHCDLIMPGYKHTTFANICDEFADNTITCISPSKTFNIAGMQCSNIFIKNEKLREKYLEELLKTAQFNRLNILGFKATEIAYTQCDEWLSQLIELIDTNRKMLTEFIENNLPQIKVINMEGTYLQWIDCRNLGIDYKELERINIFEAELFTDEGYIFGEEGIGFERLNLACPTKVLMDALERFKNALDKYIVKETVIENS